MLSACGGRWAVRWKNFAVSHVKMHRKFHGRQAARQQGEQPSKQLHAFFNFLVQETRLMARPPATHAPILWQPFALHKFHHMTFITRKPKTDPTQAELETEAQLEQGGGREQVEREQGVTGFLLALDIWVCFSSCMRHRDMLGVCESVCV